MDSLLLLVLAIVLIFGVILLAGIGRLNRQRSGLDHAFYKKQWAAVQSFKANGHTGQQLAIFEADKLLDHALRAKGFGGETMGERLKDARASLSNNNAVWSAHKLRNRLAHEQNVPLNSLVTDKALRAFKAALKDLGAL